MPYDQVEEIKRPRQKAPKRSANIHMMWPESLRTRIDQIVDLRGIKMTEIVIRVLAHADAEGYIDKWITTPPPPHPSGSVR